MDERRRRRESKRVKKSDQVFVSFYRRIPNGHIRWEKDMSLHLQQFLGVSNLKHLFVTVTTVRIITSLRFNSRVHSYMTVNGHFRLNFNSKSGPKNITQSASYRTRTRNPKPGPDRSGGRRRACVVMRYASSPSHKIT